ncbi:ras family-domain-containing protein [Anaeramoeba ignava]|uniref:Ras family-domain-containing protein n=1 Tax=Anaeramoeba ignava TaxID=1746090 RepID=A0A9Q0LDT4_ANAIG|nr:ras family-domain-containing protein [Anaeramoeba ignava]
MGEAEVDLKIILLGASGVGKTTFVNKVIYNKFEEKPETTLGASYLEKKYLSSLGSEYNFGIWDTAGQERFDSISQFYCRNAGCALIVYDITKKETFAKLDRFVDKLQHAKPDVFTIIIGTKLDMVEETKTMREVKPEEGQARAKTLNAEFFEISSKTGYNIDKVWEAIGKGYEKSLIRKGRQPANSNSNTNSNTTVKVKDISTKKGKSGCC